MRHARSLKRTILAVVLAVVISVSGQPLSTSAQPDEFSYWIDPSLEPALVELPGLSGGPVRPLATVQLPDGTQEDFVVNEVILSTTDPTVLDNFIGAYGAEILFGEDLPGDPGNLPPDRLRPSEYATTEDYLLRVNLDLADTSDFTSWMGTLGFDGEYVFSSQEAVNLNAIIAKERALNDLEISYNPLAMLPPTDATQVQGALTDVSASPADADCVMCATQEYTTTTSYANGFAFSWLNDAQLRATRAWQYYDLLEITPAPLPVLAMVDLGFALNADFPPSANVPQYDFMSETYTVTHKANTIIGNKWHGTGTLGLAAARLNNQFGTAGTGGQIAYPYLFAPEWTFYGIARAIRTAVYWGADVVNVSASSSAGSMWHMIALNKASAKAQSAGVIVLVTAGNEGKDTGSTQFLPCAVPGFLCIGGFDMSSKQADSSSNYGSDIGAWGPYNGLATTPNPDYTGSTLPGFGGTCGASAYMAGVVTLMKAVSPTLDYAGAVSLLKSTANTSTDPKLAAAGGYVNVYGAVKAAAASGGHQPQDDAYEPNDTTASAHVLTPGILTATIAPGDTDVFSFVTTDYVNLQLRVVYDDHTAPNNGLNARLDGSWGTGSGGTINLDQSYLEPGKHVLDIYGQSSDTINCYHVEFSMTASPITPDEYDDQNPPGEPRNDTLANRAIITEVVQANSIMAASVIYDLNFDVVGDTDFFEVTLPPATDPQTSWAECLDSSDSRTGEPGFYQGHLTISPYPDPGDPTDVAEGYAWPFEIKVYSTTGSIFTSTTGMNLKIECPHEYFPDGHIRFSVRGKDGRRNLYRTFLHYTRWDAPLDIPIWIWTQTSPPLVRVLPPFGGLIPWRFPADSIIIEQWFQGTAPDPLPAEFAVFHWDEARDLDLYLFTEGGRHLEMTLYDAEQQVIAATSVGGGAGMRIQATADDEGHIHVPELSPGTYVLAFGPGDFGTAYSVSIGLADVHCVNQTGGGCGSECGGGCYASVQAAVDAASDGHNVHIAGGTYTDPAGTVAAVTKPLAIVGGYSQDFGSFDPDLYQTVLDAGWNGSVISISNASQVRLEHLMFIHGDGAGNCQIGATTGGCGGGIFVQDTEVHIGSCVVEDNVANSADDGQGGGIYISNWNSNAEAHIWETQVLGNVASAAKTGWGGGLWLEAGTGVGSVDVASCVFGDNVASTVAEGQGGGVYLWQYATFSNNTFHNNTASLESWGYGGALYLHEVWGADLGANRLLNNTASVNGTGWGGAVYGSAGVVFTMTNNLVAQNHASQQAGGLWLDTYSGKQIVGTLANNTIVGNDEGAGGEGILVGDYVTLTLYNNLISGHTVGITDTSSSNIISADTNLFWNDVDPFVGANAIQHDPLLTSDYRLRESSPALDAGLNIPGLATDIEGTPRPWDEYDIGAFEGVWWEVFLPLVLRDF